MVELVDDDGYINTYLPALPDPLVERQHVLETMAQALSEEAPILFIEGESGSGATTLLAQFCLANFAPTFSIFAKPASRIAYSADYFRLLLAEQFSAYLGRPSSRDPAVDIAEFQALLLAVRKATRGKIAYLVIDGLQQVSPTERHHLQVIFKEVLPLGVSGFRFLITGAQEDFEAYVEPVRSKPYIVQKLSRSESKELLEDLGLDEGHLSSLLDLCKGMPGRLASVRRLIKSGTLPSAILAGDPEAYLDFIEMEFRIIESFAESQKLTLAVVAFSRYPITKETLCATLGILGSDIDALVDACPFLVALEAHEATLSFQSETHRKYAERTLRDFRHAAITKQIEHLSAQPSSGDALQFLPTYLQQVNQNQALLALLDSDHFSRLLSETSSFSALRARAELGIRSALEQSETVKVFQFSLQRSIFADAVKCSVFQGQVAALVALGKPKQALEVASSVAVSEQRLRMLAAYARGMKENNNPIDQEVLELIREIANALDAPGNLEEVEELAEDIAFFDPDLAISLVDKAAAPRSATDRDEALFRLSVATSVGRAETHSAIVERTIRQVSNERMRGVIGFVSSAFGSLSPDRVIEVAGPMKIDRRIFLLRSILSVWRKTNALPLVEYALDQIVSDASYRPKIDDLADFAAPLRFEEENFKGVEAAVRRIEGQLGLLEDSGSTAGQVKLQLAMFGAESLYDFPAARARVVDCYFTGVETTSVETKVEVLAHILRALQEVDRTGEIEKCEGLAAVVTDELRLSMDELLHGSASHFEIVRSALGVIAGYSFDIAHSIAMSLNTQVARDSALEYCIAKSLAISSSEGDITRILHACGDFSDPERCDAALLRAIKGIKEGGSRLPISPLIPLIEIIGSREVACEASLALLGAGNCDASASANVLTDKVRAGIDACVDNVYRTSLLFRAASLLVKVDNKHANALYEEGAAARRDLIAGNENASETVGFGMALLLRAARPLIRFGEMSDDYLARFARLADYLPDPVARIAHLSDLAMKAWCENQFTIARTILDKYVLPSHEALAENVEASAESAVRVFGAMFLLRGSRAFDLLSNVSDRQRDDAIFTTSQVMLRRVTSADPWTGGHENCLVSKSDVDDIVELIERMSSDSVIHSAIKGLVDAVTSKRSREKINRAQRVALRDRLLPIILAKLPDKRNIKHDGYLIVSEACVERLFDGRSQKWELLISQANAVPNLADRVLVLLEIAEFMPSSMIMRKRELLVTCRTEIALIPSVYDRVDRLEYFVEVANPIDPLAAKEALKNAMEYTFAFDSLEDGSSSRRRILDLADRIDPKWADFLLDSFDDDPARFSAHQALEAQVKVQKVRRKLADPTGAQSMEDRRRDVLPSAAWKNVASLVSGRAEPIAQHLLVDYVSAASEWNLHDAFPVLSWYIENLARRVNRSEDALSKVAPIWEVLLLSTELAVMVIGSAKDRQDRVALIESDSSSQVVIGWGEGSDAAMDFVRLWLQEVSEDSCFELVLSDPYFGPRDIDIIRMVLAECPSTRLTILASMKQLSGQPADVFERAWYGSMDQDPPEVEIIAVGEMLTESHPIHDRWLLAHDRGLRFGTSFGGLGGRLSEISKVDAAQVGKLSQELNPFLKRQRVVNGKRVAYTVFAL